MDENDTLPDGGTVLDSADDYSTSVDALADILDDPEEDQDTQEDTVEAADDSDDEADATDHGNDPDEDADDADEEQDADDSDDEAADESEDGPEELKGGRIAPMSAKVKLPDGSLTTVEELSKGYLRQSDYTRKRQEDAEAKRALDADRERVGQTTQQLEEKLSIVGQMLKEWEPQPPQDPQDYAGYVEYQRNKENWDQWQQQLKDQTKDLTEKQQAEQHQSMVERLQAENTRLVEKIPHLADEGKRKAFFTEASKVMADYGFSPEEVGAIGDHRLVVVMRDLMKAKRVAQKAPQVKQQIKDKPKMVKGGKRRNPSAATAKSNQSRLGRLRETGSVRDGVASLMDLDL